MTGSSSQFLQFTGRALLALGVSAVLLCGLFMVYSTSQATTADMRGSGKDILAGTMKAVVGTAKTVDSGIQITGFEHHNNVPHVIVSSRVTFNADKYPYLHYKLSNRHAGQRVTLIWRNAHSPRDISTTSLHWNQDRASTIDLVGLTNWKGRITEVGIHLTGEARGDPTVITRFALAPYSWRSAFESVWSQWAAFRGWTPSSINYLYGTSKDFQFSPVLVFSAWSGLAIFVLYLFGRVRKYRIFEACLVVVAILWIILDLMWQRNLLFQLNETKYLFSDKTVAEKHLADIDAQIYRYTAKLKAEVLPSTTIARIFIIHESPGHNFDRLKTQYYLLPHSIYNFGSQPPDNAVRPGDYVLVLGEQHGMRYREEQGRLSWESGLSIPVLVIHRDTQGTLYKVCQTVSTSTGCAP